MDVLRLFSLEGRIAVVTGGSRGIDRMIAEGFLSEGARVVICGRKVEECESAAWELSEHGECVAIGADLSSVEGIERFVYHLREQVDRIDVLVNNAGAA